MGALQDLMNMMMPKNPATGQTAMPQALPGAAPTAMLGNGMAGQAAAILASRPYQLAVQEAKAMGQPPPSPEQFMQMMSQGAAPPQ